MYQSNVQSMEYTLSQFTEEIPEQNRSPLDRKDPPARMTSDQEHWRNNGFVVLKNFIPHDLIDTYRNRFTAEVLEQGQVGYLSPTPYMKVDEIKDLCLYPELMEKLRELIGYEMGMHLNLTNWKSTERNWHQDDYLNPGYINAHYAGVWIALDDIHPDSGPFEYVPGSHQWDVCRMDKVLSMLPAEMRQDPAWPWHAEKILNPLYEQEIEQRLVAPMTWCGNKGDVLIWHAWLLHRGSSPKNKELLRPAMITHYSSVQHRIDMPNTADWGSSDRPSKYFVLS